MAQQDELVFVNWQDTKPVCVLSNYHCLTECGTVRRQLDRWKELVDVVEPEQLANYQFMKGVNFSHQMVQYYLIQHMSWKVVSHLSPPHDGQHPQCLCGGKVWSW